MAEITQIRSTAPAAWGALIGAFFGLFLDGGRGAIVGFVLVGFVGLVRSVRSRDATCSDCGGKLPTSHVKVCKHCRAKFTD